MKNRHKYSHLKSIQPNIYTFSFCEKQDYLPLWRYYGENGRGISIGFRPGYFNQAEQKDVSRENPVPIYLTISYEEEEFSKVIKEVLDSAINKIAEAKSILEKNPSNEANNIFEDFKKDLKKYLIGQILPLMPGFKHHGFKDENEHRLYYLEILLEFVEGTEHCFPFTKIPDTRKDKRPRKNEIKGICLPYVEEKIPFVKSDKFSLDDIGEIWVGPAVHYECAREQIIKILAKAGYDNDKIDKNEGIKIKKSQAPYR